MYACVYIYIYIYIYKCVLLLSKFSRNSRDKVTLNYKETLVSNERAIKSGNLVNRQWHKHLLGPGKTFLIYSSYAVYTVTLSSISCSSLSPKACQSSAPSHTVPTQIHRDARSSNLISILILKETNLLVRPISTDTSRSFCCDLPVRLYY